MWHIRVQRPGCMWIETLILVQIMSDPSSGLKFVASSRCSVGNSSLNQDAKIWTVDSRGKIHWVRMKSRFSLIRLGTIATFCSRTADKSHLNLNLNSGELIRAQNYVLSTRLQSNCVKCRLSPLKNFNFTWINFRCLLSQKILNTFQSVGWDITLWSSVVDLYTLPVLVVGMWLNKSMNSKLKGRWFLHYCEYS